VVSTKWRALRIANAITVACGLTPGARRQQRRVVDEDRCAAVHLAERVGAAAAAVLADRHGGAEVHGHHARLGGGERSCMVARSAAVAHHRRAAERRVHLGRTRLEHQQREPGEAAAQQLAIADG
jgi:hypothetical protein